MAFDLPPDMPDYERWLALRHPPYVQLHPDCRRDDACWNADDGDHGDGHGEHEPPQLQFVSAMMAVPWESLVFVAASTES